MLRLPDPVQGYGSAADVPRDGTGGLCGGAALTSEHQFCCVTQRPLQGGSPMKVVDDSVMASLSLWKRARSDAHSLVMLSGSTLVSRRLM